MNTIPAVLAIGILLGSASALPAQAEEKPLLSAEIQQVLDAKGAEAAMSRFNEIFPSRKEDYTVDLDGFIPMAAKSMQSGNTAAGQVIMEMVAALTRDAMENAGVHVPDAPAPAVEEPEVARTNDAGPSRDDLQRFVGLYSDPDKPDERHSLFAAPSCDGRLVVGATWGDASPWWMKSVSDTTFEYADSFITLRLEFQTGPDGKAQAMRHGLDSMPTPLKRIGPLPEGWVDDCVMPPGG